LLDTPLNEPRVIQKSLGKWAFRLQIMKCTRQREQHANADLSNLIATCRKLLLFASCAGLKTGCAVGNHYIASMANDPQMD